MTFRKVKTEANKRLKVILYHLQVHAGDLHPLSSTL
jgi:hypothetical protein